MIILCLDMYDDILIYSQYLSMHKQDLRQVFTILYSYHLHINMKICSFEQSKISYLGH